MTVTHFDMVDELKTAFGVGVRGERAVELVSLYLRANYRESTYEDVKRKYGDWRKVHDAALCWVDS